LDLLGTTIDIETGGWLNSVSVGPQPPVDSYYEYLLDGYRLFGDHDLQLWFQTLTAALQKRQWDAAGGHARYAQVQFQSGTLVNNHESELAAFWAGSLAEAGIHDRHRRHHTAHDSRRPHAGVLVLREHEVLLSPVRRLTAFRLQGQLPEYRRQGFHRTATRYQVSLRRSAVLSASSR